VAAGEVPGGGWDFFVSYTQADRPWAEWIAWMLEEDGHRVLVQAWDFVPGSNWLQGMQAGTRDAARTIAVLSPDYLESVYSSAEWQAAWAADPVGTDRKLLVVRVRACERPGLLAGVVGVNLYGLAEADAAARLRRMAADALAGRAKPSTAPSFPGAGRAVPHQPRFPRALPQVWRLPARNPNFTGRGSDLDEVARELAGGSAVTVHAVRGMGGVGKTQLAIEYAHAHAGDYDVVWWIAAEEPASIPDQFTTLATRMGLNPASDPEALRDQVHDALRGVQGWLLIFDNANTAAEIAPWLPPGPLLAGISGHVIVTTRRGGFAVLGHVMNLDVIGLPDAVRLLRSRVPDLGQDIGEAIAGELGRLPLALEQAAGYLDLTGMPAEEYLELLRRRAADLFARGQVSGRPDTIATLWDISLEQIRAEKPAAVQLLDACAYLSPEAIPPDLFTSHPRELLEPLSSAVADPLAFADTVAILVDYSLMKRTVTGLQLHRLAQAAIRARHVRLPGALPTDTPIPDETARRGADSVGYPLAMVLELLRADAPEKVMGAPEDWPRWAVLLPHVLAATGHLDDVGAQPSTEMMLDASSLLNRAGAYLRVRARLSDAKPILERALAIAEAAHGPDHPDVATALNDLASIVRNLGHTQTARPLQERALAIDEGAYGPDHPTVAIRLNNLAVILWVLEQREAARPLLERALAIDEPVYGPDHPEVATDLNNLGVILQGSGRQPEAARPLLERALAIDEAAYGPNHPDVATDLNNLAQTLRELGHLTVAQSLQERALAIDEAAYGPDHPTLAIRLINLAVILRELGQPEAAGPLLERALGISEAAFGPDHPEVATALNNLAVILQDLGQPDAARPLLERALAIHEVYGPDSPAVATDLNNLAQTLQELGQPETARPLQERALAIDEAIYGPDHPEVATDLINLATILGGLGQPEAARLLQERAIAITKAAQASRPRLARGS
jgi:tetratricopeptide (TPR) repeat protein